MTSYESYVAFCQRVASTPMTEEQWGMSTCRAVGENGTPQPSRSEMISETLRCGSGRRNPL
jgi:hypothetical protein